VGFSIFMTMGKLQYDVDYKGELMARIDWVAGGNFDGYLYRVHLRFLKENNTVIRAIKIVDDSRYDDDAYKEEKYEYGTYSEADERAITCVFPNFEMRGRVLGEINQYIAFSVYFPRTKLHETQCYEL
jgi:hypothetical protein